MTNQIKISYVDGNFGNDKEQKIGLVECFHKIALARQSADGHWDHLKSALVTHVPFVPRSSLSEAERKELEWDDNL